MWRKEADPLRPRWPKLAKPMDTGEHDVPAYMTFVTFPGKHRKKLHSTDPVARLNNAVERRADVVGIVPNEVLIACPVGAGPFEQNDEWKTASR